MFRGTYRNVRKGSWPWTVHIAELATWGASVVLVLVLVLAELSPGSYRLALLLGAGMALWTFLLFRVLLPGGVRADLLRSINLGIGLAFASGLFAVFRGEVPSAGLIFIPIVATSGLLGGPWFGALAGALATICFWAVAQVTGIAPGWLPVGVNGGLWLVSGSLAGLLAGELRSHYQGEQEEHRLATAVRHRLLAVLDAVDEAIVFRDRQGAVRVVNEQAGAMFELDPDNFLGRPVVDLLRTIARQTEDPEGFMETFQELRDDPERELRVELDQILPQRRFMRLYSAPTHDDSGELVGRIDVYTDISDSVRRAAEVERALEEARRTAESYQRALLPSSVPSMPNLSLVAHYLPARGRRAVCGDFYDFLALPDHSTGIVLGDVCGVGPQAANDAALTRYTLRSFASSEADPADLMAHLNSLLHEQMEDERFVRLLLGVLEPKRSTLSYVNAGHVPPVVFRFEEGKVEWLSDGGLALGVEQDSVYKISTVELAPGDTLVFYADGVTEASRNGRPFGQGRFQDLIEQYGAGTPGELAQAIRRAVRAWGPADELRDDISLVVCQAVLSASGNPTRELVLPNEAARIGEVRSFVATYLAELRAPIDASYDVVLAVGEAASNACRYGRNPSGDGELRVRCVREGSNVVVTVADDGPGFQQPSEDSDELPDRFASGGRGRFLMKKLMDSVTMESTSEGTTIVLARALF